MDAEILIAWASILDFYDELIEKYGWSQQPMKDLIGDLENVGFHKRYWPSTSHDSLGLSLERDYAKRLDSPMVYIRYRSNSDNFKISYQAGQGRDVKHNIEKKLCDSDLKEIETWLEN